MDSKASIAAYRANRLLGRPQPAERQVKRCSTPLISEKVRALPTSPDLPEATPIGEAAVRKLPTWSWDVGQGPSSKHCGAYRGSAGASTSPMKKNKLVTGSGETNA